MGKVRVKLYSYSHVKGAEGVPGDTVEMEESQAKSLVAGRGAEIISQSVKQPQQTKAQGK